MNPRPTQAVPLAKRKLEKEDTSPDNDLQWVDKTLALWQLAPSMELDDHGEEPSTYPGALPISTESKDEGLRGITSIEVPNPPIENDETNLGSRSNCRTDACPEISPGNDSGIDVTSPSPTPPPDEVTIVPVVANPDPNSSLPDLSNRTRELLGRPRQKPPPLKRQVQCHICQKYVNNNGASILAHIKGHQGHFADHQCNTCEVGFQHAEDLLYHLKCAAEPRPHCGFKFEHAVVCNGHHPPEPYQPPESYPDHDRFKLGYFARNWEGLALQCLTTSMDPLLYGATSDPYRWSSREPDQRRFSLASFASTIASFRSTPVNVDYSMKSSAAMDSRFRRLRPGAITNQILEERRRVAALQQVKRDATRFGQAIEDDDLLAVREMLSNGFALDTFLPGRKYEISKKPMKAFALAASLGRVVIIRSILDHETNLEVLGKVPGTSPLLNMLLAKEFDCAAVLLAAGASVDQDMHGYVMGSEINCTLINYFTRHGCTLSVRLLVNHGARVHVKELEIAWERAISDGYMSTNLKCEKIPSTQYVDMLRCMLGAQQWATPHVLSNFLECTLPEAIAQRREDLLRLLIDHGADVHQQIGFRQGSALIEASYAGDLNIANFLLSKGLNAKSHNGYLSLCIAANMGQSDLVRLLVHYGAPFRGEHRPGSCPTYDAIQFSHERIVQALSRAGIHGPDRMTRKVDE